LRKKSTQHANGSKKINEDELDTSKFLSLDILFDHTKERNKAQLEQTDKLDNKAITVLTSASAIVSAALILQAVLPPLSNISPIMKFLTELPLMLLLVIYLTTMCGGLIVLMVHTYKLTPDPVRLYEEYLFKDENFTKAKLLKSMIDDYKDNKPRVDNQAYWVKYAIVAIWIEAVLFVIYLVVHTAH
jgi:hypothetical protein